MTLLLRYGTPVAISNQSLLGGRNTLLSCGLLKLVTMGATRMSGPNSYCVSNSGS
jgi:hypothetical protein